MIASTALIVGDASLAGAVRDRPTLCVDNYYDALGRISSRHEPAIGAIVGRLEPMLQNLDATVDALRRLRPAVRVILVARADQEPDAMRAVRLGVDDYLIDPLEPGELAAALGPAAVKPEADSDGEAPGDLALVESLLADDVDPTDRAVQLVRRRSGIDDVGWSAEPQDDAAGCVAAGGGYLISRTADAQALQPHAHWLSRWLELAQHMKRLSDQADRDALTGLWNRRYFDRSLESILRRARDERFCVTLMLWDVDRFKDYNDRYGHAVGDRILRQVGELMRSVVREQDVVARIGGDELAVIFHEAEPPRRPGSEHRLSVETVARRFRAAMQGESFELLGPEAPGPVTLSAGVAGFPWDAHDAAGLFEAADRRLRDSKQGGKNQISFGPR